MTRFGQFEHAPVAQVGQGVMPGVVFKLLSSVLQLMCACIVLGQVLADADEYLSPICLTREMPADPQKNSRAIRPDDTKTSGDSFLLLHRPCADGHDPRPVLGVDKMRPLVTAQRPVPGRNTNHVEKPFAPRHGIGCDVIVPDRKIGSVDCHRQPF